MHTPLRWDDTVTSTFDVEVKDPVLREFLMELASEGPLPQERLFRLEKDLVRQLPQIALESERTRIRSKLGEAAKGGDRRQEQALLERLQLVNQRLDELWRDGQSSLTH